MKVYFTASIAAKEKYLPKYTQIIQFIKSKGIEVVSEHITRATESSIRLSTREERLTFHNQLEEWIRTCDFMVVEASFPSVSVGYEISMAVRFGKPILILYSQGHPPSLFEHFKSERVLCEQYSSNTLKEIINEFINYISKRNELRYSFMITPAMVEYLNKVSNQKKISKSEYVRKLIIQDRALH